jgi:peptide/nickel transport system permease protein
MANYAPLPIMLAIFVGLAPALRLYRSFFLDEIDSDYVRTARAKGLSENKVLKHVMRNAMIPIISDMVLPCRVCLSARSCWSHSSRSRVWGVRSWWR